MKKLVILFTLTLFLTGCTLGINNNTPTKKVEMFLSKYQKLDEGVLEDLNNVIMEDANFEKKQQDRYRDLMKKHYQDLTYDIQEEKIDGDEATVVTQIEVRDYTKAKAEARIYKEKNENKFNNEKGEYQASKYYDYVLDQFEKVKDKVTYTINFKLTKKDGEWKLKDLTNEQEQKIHGIYEY